MELVWPAKSFLAGYVQALERGWSPNTIRLEAAGEELAAIERDADSFLSSLVDRDAVGEPVMLPNGSTVARLPGYRRWMWDGEFCGSIGFRWQPGTPELPSYVLGHIGYSVVPWKRRRGYATRALGLLLIDVAAEGLDWVEVTTDMDNAASQRVIEANGGVFIERFVSDAYGGPEKLRYRIDVPPHDIVRELTDR
jgi:predicted acetyltransferase